MKRLFALIALSICMASCASISPIGDWNYTVTGTPNGDYAGVMKIKKDKSQYEVVLTGQAGEIPFNTFVFDPKTKKSTGNFTFQGTPIEFEAIVTKTDMNGSMGVEDGKFPFKATRKVQ